MATKMITLSPSAFVFANWWIQLDPRDGLGRPIPEDAIGAYAISVLRYISGNPEFTKDNSVATTFKASIIEVLKKKGKTVESHFGMTMNEFAMMFTGQPTIEGIRKILEFVRSEQALFETVKNKLDFKKRFEDAYALQWLMNDGAIGYDCIGFVGRYLAWSGVLPSYPYRVPRQYMEAPFVPVTSIAEIKPLSLVIFANGKHIQIVDSVYSRTNTSATVLLCQSSAGGPQYNNRVTITPDMSHSDLIDFAKYNADVAALDRQLARKEISQDDYNAKREQMKKTDLMSGERSFGYRGARIFKIGGDGTPKNPSSARCYLFRHPDAVATYPSSFLENVVI